MLLEADPIVEEKSCKQGAISANSFNSRKIILILLTEVIVLYIRLTIIELWGPGL